jgi:hypothetical protein
MQNSGAIAPRERWDLARGSSTCSRNNFAVVPDKLARGAQAAATRAKIRDP